MNFKVSILKSARERNLQQNIEGLEKCSQYYWYNVDSQYNWYYSHLPKPKVVWYSGTEPATSW